MGNYQDYLKKQPLPLREIESSPVRQHMFGNPFKINKNMILDEVVDEVAMQGAPGGGQGQGQLPSTGKAAKRALQQMQHLLQQDGIMVMPGGKRVKKGKNIKIFDLF